MKLRFRTVFWAAAALLTAAIIGWSFWPRPALVDTASVVQGPMSVQIRDEGRTRIRDVYAIAVPVAGRLLRVDLEPGDAVAAGDILARVLPLEPDILDARRRGEAEAAVSLAEAALAAARAEAQTAASGLELAREDYGRSARLHATGIASRAQLDRAAAELRAAEAAARRADAAIRMRNAEVEAARIHLHGPSEEAGTVSIFDIRSPIDGVVLRVVRESEGPIAAGTTVMDVGDPAGLEIVADFLSADAIQASPGDPAEITGWSRDAAALPASVRRVEPFGTEEISALGVEEQRVNIVLDFTGDRRDWSALGHGYRIEAAITVWQRDDALQIPVASLFRHEGGWSVYRVEDGRARRTAVSIGRDNGLVAEVLSGLNDGDTVILYPGEGIEDGRAIQARDVQP